MAFATRLQTSLGLRDRQALAEQAAGDSLEAILDRHLRAIEVASETDFLTSVLLLDSQGRRLLYGAAPSLPKSYCDAIHGVEIGPDVGSCGAAAYLQRPVYVTDIATDPLWRNYKQLALPHGLRACWSTPIHDVHGRLLGTFAIYHLTPRGPTREELEAVGLITRHVAEAIARCREAPSGAELRHKPGRSAPRQADGAPTQTSVRQSTARSRLWRRMQQIERCRHRGETAIRRSDNGSPTFRREMAEAAQEWSRLAREYELLLQAETGD